MTDKLLHPGLGSGALREALRKIVDEYDKYLAGPERLPTVGLIEAIAYGGELLSLSSPIEPPRDSRLLDTLTELLSDTELVIHAPSQEWNSRWTDATHELYERRENPKWATPQASSEVRERVQAILDKWDDGKNNYRGRVILLELKAALAPSRQGAGGTKS